MDYQQQLHTDGFAVISGVIPAAMCDAVTSALWQFLEMDPHIPEDWYRPPLSPGGMVEMYHQPAMWAVRQYRGLYELFCSLYRREDLWVSIDRVGMKPPYHPEHPEYDHKGFIHWDIDVRKLPVEFGLQGVLCLADTEADMGGFCCVPGFHLELEEYLTKHPTMDGHRPIPGTFPTPTPIPAKQGDLIVWDKRLLHGNGRNLSANPRLAMYVTMFPAEPDNAVLVEERRTSWETRTPPPRDYFPGDPRGWEAAHYGPVELTELGRRLLGG